ncbi:MAG: carboxymuconolactone decarboxylase family protein [Actinomycetota bacterium]|nr:carboxymuconolactone decarboxylase family protein [Actinomycetota bacterium]
MAHIELVSRDDLTEHEPLLARFERVMGTVPNSLLAMAHRPAILEAFSALAAEISGRGTVDLGFKQLVAHVASTSAGCRYCQAHTASLAEHRYGVDVDRIAAVWEFETNDLFTDTERAALRLARDAGLQPNAVTKQHFDELAPHFDQGQMVELVAIISLFGFLNRWNETIATDLEDKPFEFASRHLHEAGWEPGRHRPEG